MKTCPVHHHKPITHTCAICKVSCCEKCGKICRGCLTKIGVVIVLVMLVAWSIVVFGIF